MTVKTQSIRQDILVVLQKAGDEGMTIASIASQLECGQACLRAILAELGGTMAIRSTQGLRNVRFWIPSEERLKAEEEARKVQVTHPLKIDRVRRELYERIAQERLAIVSIG
jgi:hypothetical protein